MLPLALYAALATAAPTYPSPGQVTESSPHYDLELLYTEGKFEEGKKLAIERSNANPDDVDLYWHVARYIFEIGENFERGDEGVDKIALYEEMASWAERGLEKAPGHPHLTFALGIAEGRLGTTRGVLSSLFLAKGVEQAWLDVANSGFEYRSIKGNETLPCDAYLTLGIFYRLVPEWWIVKVLAGTRGDLQKSVEWNTKADKCVTGRIGVIKELGVSQLCFGEKRKDAASLAAGQATLARALAIPPTHNTDYIDKKHIAKLMDDPSLACEYSRDGQQELDEKQLEKEKKGK